MIKKVKKIITIKQCDKCGVRNGDFVADESGAGLAMVRKAKYWAKYYAGKGWDHKTRPTNCNHDICSECWYFPGDLIRCPKCNPDIDKARDEDKKAGRE